MPLTTPITSLIFNLVKALWNNGLTRHEHGRGLRGLSEGLDSLTDPDTCLYFVGFVDSRSLKPYKSLKPLIISNYSANDILVSIETKFLNEYNYQHFLEGVPWLLNFQNTGLFFGP